MMLLVGSPPRGPLEGVVMNVVWSLLLAFGGLGFLAWPKDGEAGLA